MGKARIVRNEERLVWDGYHEIEVQENNNCCGLREISGIQFGDDETEFDPFTIICGMVEYSNARNGVHDYLIKASQFIFTQATNCGPMMGDKLAAYIKRHKLGLVVRTKGRRNLGSNNTVTAFIWEPNKAATDLFSKIEGMLTHIDN